MARPLKVLILEDRASDAELIVYELYRAGFEPDWQRVENEADYLAALAQQPHIILADYSLPQWDAPRALALLQKHGLDIPFIVISGTVGEDIAVECVRSGAADYLLKDRLVRLGQAVDRALEERALRAEKQRAEEEILRLKEFNENIIQTMAEGIVMQDPDGVLTFVNPAAAAVVGYQPEELIQQHRNIVIPTDQRPLAQKGDERRKRGLFDRYELELLHKNGQRRTVLVSGTPRFEGGRFVGSLIVFTDITERKQIEQAEREQRALAEALRDTAAILTSSLDFDTVMNRILEHVGRVVPHDAANIMLIEVDAARVVAHHGYNQQNQMVPDSYRFSLNMPNLREMASTGQPMFIPDTVADRNWITLPATAWIRSYAAAPIRVKDQIIGFLNLDSVTPGFFNQEHARRLQVFADQAATAIHNARLYEEIRRRAAEMEQRVAARTAELARAKEQVEAALAREIELSEIKSRFISMASHEFRTPMAVIQSCAGILEQYGDRLSAELRKKEFDRIRFNIGQMVDLLDDVLLINKTEAGKLGFSPEMLNLETFCREILSEYERTIGTEHHFVFSAVNACLRVWIDPRLLRHIIGNLLSNAIKYSDSGSTVTFAVQCQDTQVLINIHDEGIGIPPEDQPHLFEAFFRADNVGSVPGTGLGLAIVKQMVDLHQGTIALESTPGVGTQFTITLPLMRASEE